MTDWCSECGALHGPGSHRPIYQVTYSEWETTSNVRARGAQEAAERWCDTRDGEDTDTLMDGIVLDIKGPDGTEAKVSVYGEPTVIWTTEVMTEPRQKCGRDPVTARVASCPDCGSARCRNAR